MEWMFYVRIAIIFCAVAFFNNGICRISSGSSFEFALFVYEKTKRRKIRKEIYGTKLYLIEPFKKRYSILILKKEKNYNLYRTFLIVARIGSVIFIAIVVTNFMLLLVVIKMSLFDNGSSNTLVEWYFMCCIKTTIVELIVAAVTIIMLTPYGFWRDFYNHCAPGSSFKDGWHF